MRNFDNWNRYQDNSGNPLHGCIQFNVKDGDTVAPIYDSDDTPLDNPQLTDIYGRTQHQVFIDQDVVAYYYKFVGEGNWTGEEDIDTSDVTKWSLQYTSDNTADTVIKVETDNVPSVSSMNSLRAVDPDDVPEVDGMKILTLLGYTTTGDKEPVDYIWVSSSAENDDGGSVIQPDGLLTGRWIMVQPTEHCDSRHFGVFPSSSYNMADQNYGIQKLFDYCNVKSIRPFFNGSTDYRWFRYSNISVSASEIDVSDGTIFYDDGSSSIEGNWNGNPHFYNGNTTVISCDDARTSWNAAAYTSVKNITIDEPTSQNAWQDCVVVLEIPVTGNTFNDCVISETGNLYGEDNQFVNCRLTGKMFDSDAAIIGKVTNCQIDIDDFKDNMDLYVEARMTSDTNPNLDYRNIATNVNPVKLYNANVINSSVVRVNNYNSSTSSPVVIDKLNNSILEITNTTGVFNLGAYTTGSTVYIKDCVDIEIRTIGGGCALVVENSRIVLGQNARVMFSLSLNNSVATSDYDVTTSQYGHFTSFNSIMSVPVTSNNIIIKDSQMNAAVNYVANGEGTLYFENNIVNNTLTLSGDSGTRTIVGLIANNYGGAGTPILVNRTYLDPVDSHHSYSYYNNGGTFPKRSVSFTENTTVIADIQNFTGTEWFWTLAEGQYGFHDPYIGFATYYYDDGQAYYRHHFKFQTQFTVFRIGTDEQEVKVDWKLNSNNASSSGYVTPNPFYAKIVHTAGESYRLEGIWTGGEPTSPMTAQGYNTAYFNAATAVQSLGTATFNNTYSFEL